MKKSKKVMKRLEKYKKKCIIETNQARQTLKLPKKQVHLYDKK